MAAQTQNGNKKARQVLRDPDTAEFLADQVDELIKRYIAEANDPGAEDRPPMAEREKAILRRDIKRLRSAQVTLRHNATQSRTRAGEDFPDEI